MPAAASEKALPVLILVRSVLSSPAPVWTYSCPRWREVRPALRPTFRRSRNRSSRNASSPPSEMKAGPLHSGKTRHRTANPGVSDRETTTTDPNPQKHQARMQPNETFTQIQLFLGTSCYFDAPFGYFFHLPCINIFRTNWSEKLMLFPTETFLLEI